MPVTWCGATAAPGCPKSSRRRGPKRRCRPRRAPSPGGMLHPVPRLPTRTAQSDLHHQHHGVAELPPAQSDQEPRPLRLRSGSPDRWCVAEDLCKPCVIATATEEHGPESGEGSEAAVLVWVHAERHQVCAPVRGGQLHTRVVLFRRDSLSHGVREGVAVELFLDRDDLIVIMAPFPPDLCPTCQAGNTT